MKRREFLATSAIASATAAVGSTEMLGGQQASKAGAREGQREYYELRCYRMQSGPQQKLMDGYLAEALIPALNRLGVTPVGAFNLYLGPQTPALYVLLPAPSAETLAMAETRLAEDPEYMRAGAAFLKAPAKEPAYERMESSLMRAFTGFPKLRVTPVTAQKGARVFQLRTYESPGMQDHITKVEMFNSGEFDIFEKAGFWNVFFGDTLIGPRLPNLTYMVSFPDLAELNAKWKAFNDNPDWKKLRETPKFSFEPIVTNVSNLILNPTSYSQV